MMSKKSCPFFIRVVITPYRKNIESKIKLSGLNGVI